MSFELPRRHFSPSVWIKMCVLETSYCGNVIFNVVYVELFILMLFLLIWYRN